MAEAMMPARLVACLLLGGGILASAGCVSTNATASMGKVPTAVEQEAEARVQFVKDRGCADPATEVLSVAAVHEVADGWASSRRLQGYEHPETRQQTRRVKYPPEELFSGPGAVLVLIRVEADGSVGSSAPVCATHEVFLRYARDTVADNVYVPARHEGRSVRGVAFQTVVFGGY